MRRFSLRNIFLPVSTLLLLTLFQSCENELDVNADWKEVIVVYALLDPLDSVQYVKINKAFQNNETGALVAAQEPDSLFLDSVDVVLTNLNSGVSYSLVKDNNLQKDSGIFAHTINTLYKTQALIIPGNYYKLDVLSIKTGKRVTAEALVVGPANIVAPFRDSTTPFSIGNETIVVNFSSGINTAVYDVRMEVVYQEFPASDTNAKVLKSETWRMLTNLRTQSTSGFNNITARIPRTAFLQFLGGSITAAPSLLHRILHVNLTFYGGSELLSDYISVSEPSLGIVQKQADYTNINGGTGLFASRCIQKIVRVPLDPSSISILQSRPETAPLNFRR